MGQTWAAGKFCLSLALEINDVPLIPGGNVYPLPCSSVQLIASMSPLPRHSVSEGAWAPAGRLVQGSVGLELAQRAFKMPLSCPLNSVLIQCYTAAARV